MKSIPLSAALVLALFLPTAAFAQGEGAPAKPAPPLKTAEEVIVTQSTSGQELRGYLLELSPTTLAMLVNGQRVDVPLERVLRIEGRNDSVKNGAAIGAAVGGGLILLACGGEIGPEFCVTGALFYAGIGALAGAGIDALHKGRTTIYSKPAALSLAVAPAPKGARAQFKIRW